MAELTVEDRLRDLTPEELSEVREGVETIARLRREQARLDGEIASRMARLVAIAHRQGEAMATSHGPEYARRAMAAEVAAATRVHPSSARSQLAAAEALLADFPVTHGALLAGEVTQRHVRAIVDAGANLGAGAKATLDRLAVGLARSRTPGETERIVRLQSARLASRSPGERHREARRERRVGVTDLDDGMSELSLVAPTFHVHAIRDRLTRMARQVDDERRAARKACAAAGHGRPDGGWSAFGDGAEARATAEAAIDAATGLLGGFPGDCRDLVNRAGDDRSFDQLRADLLSDILLTAAPTGHELHSAGSGAALGNVRASIQVTLPARMILSGGAGGDDGACFGGGDDGAGLRDGDDGAGTEGGDDRAFAGGSGSGAGCDGGRSGHDDGRGRGRDGDRRDRIRGDDGDDRFRDDGRGDRGETGGDLGVAWDDTGAVIACDDALAAAGHASGWDRLFIAPDTGELLVTDRYRPTTAQRRYLAARDGGCRFPGCTAPASRCDVDHTRDHALGGPTSIGNLACLCEQHHMMKHGSGWKVHQIGGGLLEWQGPSGRTYTNEPRAHVMFREAGADTGEDRDPDRSTNAHRNTNADIGAGAGASACPGVTAGASAGVGASIGIDAGLDTGACLETNVRTGADLDADAGGADPEGIAFSGRVTHEPSAPERALWAWARDAGKARDADDARDADGARRAGKARTPQRVA